MYSLEEKIKTLSTEYIEQETYASFLLLLMSILEREQSEEIHYKIHDDILELQNKTKHYTLELESILDDDNKEVRLAALDDCLDLKKKLISIYETVYQYTSLWNLHFTRVKDEVAIRKYKEENVDIGNLDWEAFYLDCEEFLESTDESYQKHIITGELLKCIPLQMARAKYYDIIKKSLENSFSEESEEMITFSLNNFYDLFLPHKNKNYGKYFTELSEWLFSRKDVTPNTLSDEALREEYTDYNTIFDELKKIEEMFCCLFNDINSLIILFYLGYSFSELTEKDITYADLYHTVCEMLQCELSETEKEAYSERVNTSLEQSIEKVIDKANDIGKKEIKLLKKIDDFSVLSDDTHKILLTEDFVRNCYFGDLNDEIFQNDIPADLPAASYEWKQKTFDDFIENMKQEFAEFSVPVRKTAMQLFLSVLPPIFTVEEIIAMIRYAVESANTLEQKILILDKIGMVFEEHDFRCDEDDDENLKLSDFEFDEFCDCGHDHHHYHDHHHHDHEHHHHH